MRKVRNLCKMLFWLSVIFILGYFVATEITRTNSCYIPHTLPSSFSSGWTDADTGKPVTSDFVQVRSGETIHLKCQLPADLYDGMTLYVWTHYFNVTASIDGRVIAEGNHPYPFLLGYHQPRLSWLPIALHTSDQHKFVELSITNESFDGLFDIMDIRLGSPDSAANMIWANSLPAVVESMIILVIGILLMVYYFILRYHHYDAYRLAIMFLAACALSSCVWIFNTSALPQLITGNSSGTSALSFYSYMLLPIFGILFFMKMIPDRTREFMTLLTIYMIILACGTIVISTGITTLFQVLPFNHLFCVVMIICVTAFAIIEYRKSHDKDMLYLVLAYFFEASGSVADLFVYYMYPRYDITQPFRIGLITFIIILCFTTIRASLRQFSDLRAAQYYKKLAYIDTVTGGNTRQRFDELIQKFPDSGNYWFIHINIFYFRIINEAFGREKCDEVLSCIYSSCASLLNSSETLCNLGDSCMALYMKEPDANKLRSRLTGINQLIQKRIRNILNGPLIQLEYCLYKIDDNDTNLNHIQDYALMSRRNPDAEFWSDLNAYVYNGQCRKHLLEDKRLENLLENALQHHEITPYLQPKVSPHTGEVKGAEALARWISPTQGMIYPSVFIPLFERNGNISRIDLSIFEQVCDIINSWVSRGLVPPVISVNISKAALQDTSFFDRYIAIIKQKKVPAQYLEFELTESIAYDNMQLINEILEKIHAIGSRCSMDDFGKSYSNLNALGSLPFDTVKMDMCFFDSGFPEDHKQYLLVIDSMKLLKDLHMEIVTEGIETASQVDALNKMGVDLIQGYFYAKPLSPDEFEVFWAQHRALS